MSMELRITGKKGRNVNPDLQSVKGRTSREKKTDDRWEKGGSNADRGIEHQKKRGRRSVKSPHWVGRENCQTDRRVDKTINFERQGKRFTLRNQLPDVKRWGDKRLD